MHYVKRVAIKDNSKKHANENIIGVYSSLSKLQDSYVMARQTLQSQQESIATLLGTHTDDIAISEIDINTYDEYKRYWSYDISPEKLFLNW